MGKRRARSRPLLDPDVGRRLEGIGPYEVVTDPGVCEIHWDELDVLSSDLAAFRLLWVIGTPGPAVPAPDDRMFDIWERYRRGHREQCKEYKRRLFRLFSASAQAKYEDGQWERLRRKRPTSRDLRGVVSQGTVEIRRFQDNKSVDYELRVSFVVFWDDHGVVFKLAPEDDRFQVVAWGAGEV